MLTKEISVVELRLLNVFMLMKLYFKSGDFERVIRFLSENTKANMYIKDLMEKLAKEANLANRMIQNYVLYLYQILAHSYAQKNIFDKAKSTYFILCKIFNRWKVNNRAYEMADEESDLVVAEFGIDDYIRAKAGYAEAIMNLGEVDHAIEKLENAKQSIENEIVYENPMLFINICHQLGTCYLQESRRKSLDRALDNYELALVMINEAEQENKRQTRPQISRYIEPISPMVVAKICLNIALIRS
mmetsp:Transcript_40874/g.62294  ORF Transcript_40874/g.62294 Transcript_40874/m.62294 type:complete len:245 (+) Transcript_40874:501-1235(+)